MRVHQCSRYNADQRLSHKKAVMRIVNYLKGTSDQGTIYTVNEDCVIECYVDAYFAGSWDQSDSDNAENVFSWNGYVIMYAGCPLILISKLESEIILSAAEAGYIMLSQSLQ